MNRVQEIKALLNKLFSDASVSPQVTLDALDEVTEEAETLRALLHANEDLEVA